MHPFRRRATRAPQTLDATSIRDLITDPIQRGASPGLIAAVIDRRGVRAVAAAGVRKAGHSQPLLATDSVHIGSNTKAMTSTMLAVLVHDGALGWNTTIAEVFPELRADVHAAYHPVTLWQLVTMTGGIKPDAADWHAHGDACLVQRRYRILRDNLVDPPAASVGKHLYSNLDYVVAGAMAERVTARSWESLMQERLFAPLGISSAGFGAPGVPGELDQPWGHQRDPASGNWVPCQLDNAAALGPAGTVHITIGDWAKFLALWLADGPPTSPDRETLARLITPVAGRYAQVGGSCDDCGLEVGRSRTMGATRPGAQSCGSPRELAAATSWPQTRPSRMSVRRSCSSTVSCRV